MRGNGLRAIRTRGTPRQSWISSAWARRSLGAAGCTRRRARLSRRCRRRVSRGACSSRNASKPASTRLRVRSFPNARGSAAFRQADARHARSHFPARGPAAHPERRQRSAGLCLPRGSPQHDRRRDRCARPVERRTGRRAHQGRHQLRLLRPGDPDAARVTSGLPPALPALVLFFQPRPSAAGSTR